MQLCLFSQRWRERRESYRPAGEPINPRLYEVAELAGDREAKAFILAHHYSASYPSARVRFGLFTRGCLVGVAVFSHPCNDRVLTSVFPLSPLDSVELGRFVLLDSVPANGESWFLTRTFECLRRKGLSGVVSFSDPVPRTKADGTIVHRGHVGICYQATSATFLGRTEPRTIRLLPGRRPAERPHDPEDPVRGTRLALRSGAARNVRSGIHSERRPRGLAANVATQTDPASEAFGKLQVLLGDQ